MSDTILIASQAPWFDTSIPAVNDYTAAMDEYVPGLTTDPQFGPNLLSPWIGGKLFEAAVKAGKLTPSSTPAQLKDAMYELKDETLGGLTGPLNYTPGKPAIPACYWTVNVKDGEFANPQGASPTCPPADMVNGLASALAQAAG
jgi:branched-chain amino acid transport system substrate-binding protein